MYSRIMLGRLTNAIRFLLLPLLILAGSSDLLARGDQVTGKVTVILEKLPKEFQEKMENFDVKVMNYIDSRDWIEEDYVVPFSVGFQFFLEHSPSSVEDRYNCSLIASGPDIQYYDKRAIFPFQENETIQETGGYVPINGLIDFYVYLIIANELDKYGPMEGDKYFERAQAVLQEAKFSRYVRGWDDREETILETRTELYKKFRKLKDYYFYAIWGTDNPEETRKYAKIAVKELETVLKEDNKFQAARQFIDAHYQEVAEIFKGTEEKEPIRILAKLDPERKQFYDEYLARR